MHACWMKSEVQNVTLSIGSYGTGQEKTFEIRRISMIRLLNDLHLLPGSSVKNKKKKKKKQLEALCQRP